MALENHVVIKHLEIVKNNLELMRMIKHVEILKNNLEPILEKAKVHASVRSGPMIISWSLTSFVF